MSTKKQVFCWRPHKCVFDVDPRLTVHTCPCPVADMPTPEADLKQEALSGGDA